MDGFNTFEKQDKVLLGLNSGSDAAAAMRILQQQGFAVQTFTAEHEVTPAGLLQLLADKAAELDCAFIATGHYARIEVDGEGLSHLLPAADEQATQQFLAWAADYSKQQLAASAALQTQRSRLLTAVRNLIVLTAVSTRHPLTSSPACVAVTDELLRLHAYLQSLLETLQTARLALAPRPPVLRSPARRWRSCCWTTCVVWTF